jgi:CheY-like chemotaxis protein
MCHVLIIEDEPMIAMLIQDALEEAGVTSFAFAATEQDAVDLALQHPPEAITADVRLMDGTGPAAVERIRAKVGSIPAIYITGSPEACKSCDPVLIKPVTTRQVIGTFQQVMLG